MTHLRLGVVLFVTAAVAAACTGPSATSSVQPSATPPSATSFQETGSPAASTNPASPSPQPSALPFADLEWTVTGAFAGANGPAMVGNLVVLGDVIVATGIGYDQGLPNLGPTPPHRPRVWTSADGRNWEAVELGDEFQDAHLGTVVVRADGTLLAMGSLRSPSFDEPPTPAAWTSVDGRKWSEASSGLPGTPSQVVQGLRGYLALYGSEQEPDELWHSSDGFTWQRVLQLELDQAAGAVGAGPEGFVVAGSEGPNDSEPFVIASGDGREWFEASRPPTRPVQHVAPLGDDWVVMDTFGSNGASGTTWFSANGLEWDALGRAELGEVAIQDGRCFEYPAGLSAGGPWLVLATILSFPCSEGGFAVHARQLISVDGATWSQLPFEMGTPGVTRSGSFVNAALALDGRLILAGERDGAATFWIGEPH